MSAGVYIIRHLVSDKLYVGSSQSVHRRLGAHKGHLRRGTHHSPYLQNAWNKYGPDAFEFKQVVICSLDTRLFYEQLLIDGLKPAYNTALIAGTCEGVKKSPELCASISQRMRHRRANHEWKGQKRSLIEIAEMEGFNHQKLISRVCGLGHTIQQALSHEPRIGRYELEHEGRTQTVTQWAKELGIHPRRLSYRIQDGYSIADVINRLGREAKSMSFSELCRLNGANLQTSKSRVQGGMSMMQAVTQPPRHKETV